jgi:hypothetical protein
MPSPVNFSHTFASAHILPARPEVNNQEKVEVPRILAIGNKIFAILGEILSVCSMCSICISAYLNHNPVVFILALTVGIICLGILAITALTKPADIPPAQPPIPFIFHTT